MHQIDFDGWVYLIFNPTVVTTGSTRKLPISVGLVALIVWVLPSTPTALSFPPRVPKQKQMLLKHNTNCFIFPT